MRYQDAVAIHGENTSQYWKCISGCTNCCPMGREQEIFVPATLFDIWREYALRNPGGEPFYRIASQRFGLRAVKAGEILDAPAIYDLEPDKYYVMFSRQNPCGNLRKDATGCIVHGSVAMGPNCFGVPEGRIGANNNSIHHEWEEQEFYPCTTGKALPPEERARMRKISPIAQHEMGLSMRSMKDIQIAPDDTTRPVLDVPELEAPHNVEKMLLYLKPEEQLGVLPLATTQALARLIGQSNLKGELWFNGITPLEEKYIDGFLRTLP